MTPQNFTEEDKKKLIDFLNYVAENATFTHKTEGVIKYFALLSFMQKVMLPKIDANILEVVRIVEAKAEEKVPPKSKAEKTKGA